MKIKEVPLSEIHWSIKKWNGGKQANDELRKRLGPGTLQYFASCFIGNAYYQWSTNINGQWMPLTEADPAQRELVAERMAEIKQEVIAKMANDPELAEQVMEVPTIDYIYFKPTAEGKVDVIITGWGFRNFKNDPPFRIKTKPKKPVTPNTIAFAIDGQQLPNRTFTLKAPWTNKPEEKLTNADGLFTIEESADTPLEITDTLTGKQFNIVVNNSQPAHVFDLTEKTALTIQAFADGQPVNGDPVSVDYGGQHYDLTMENGQATIPYLTLHRGHSCQVILRGEEQNVEPTLEGPNVVTFQFQTPLPTIEHGALTIEAYADGQPINGELVSIDYCGQHYDLPLQNGTTTIADLVISQGQPATAYMRDAQQSATLVKDENVLLRFDFQTPPPEPITARLAALDFMGVPMRGAQFHMQQGDTVLDGILDDQGQVFFIKDPFMPGQPIAVNIVTPNQQQLPPAELILEPQENDYVLQLNAPKQKSRLLEIIMFILLLLALAALLIFVFKPGIDGLSPLINNNLFCQ